MMQIAQNIKKKEIYLLGKHISSISIKEILYLYNTQYISK